MSAPPAAVPAAPAGAVTAGAAGGAGALAAGGGGAFAAGAAAAFASAASSIRIGEPSDTLSPIFTIRLFTVPADGDGISIVALSDSSVISDCSGATSSPGFTRISMTSTLLKSPMSGTFTSTMRHSLQHHPPEVGEELRKVDVEPRRGRAVDHAVIPRDRERQDQPRGELLAVPHRPRRRAAHAEDCDLGRVDDRREVRAADAAEARDRERAALHVARLELTVARELGEVRKLVRDVEHALAVGVAHDRHDQAARRVDRHADVVVLLDDHVLARLVERGVELRELPQRGDAGLDHEGEHRQLETLLLGLDGLRLAERLEVGD